MWVHMQPEVGHKTLSFQEKIGKKPPCVFNINTLGFKPSNTFLEVEKPGTPVPGLVKAL